MSQPRTVNTDHRKKHHVVYIQKEVYKNIENGLNSIFVKLDREVNAGDTVCFFEIDDQSVFTGETSKLYTVKIVKTIFKAPKVFHGKIYWNA